MEELIFGLIIITAIICYTVYKIDCNHVNKPENNYPTGGLEKQPEHGMIDKVPASDELKALLKQKAESNRPSEETMKSLFGKDYKKGQ